MDEHAQTQGFYTQFALVPLNHATSRRLLGRDLQGQISFNNKGLMASVFKVNTVPKTWLDAANKALDGVSDVFTKLRNARNEKDMYEPLVSVGHSSAPYINKLTSRARNVAGHHPAHNRQFRTSQRYKLQPRHLEECR